MPAFLRKKEVKMVDLKANPYYLSDEDCKWVEDTIASMTPEEKVGQLFFQLTASHDEEYLKDLMEKYHLGGCRYNPAPGKVIQEQNRKLQKYAKAINPDLKDEDMMPATLSPEIMTVLLRDRLGFNGMVVTDASHMVGMTDRMTRAEMLPRAINAGCDMFLFFNDPAELLKEKLCAKGFDAFIYESPLDIMKKQMAEGKKPDLNIYFAGKNAIADFVKDMDLVITLCDVSNGRPSFGMSKGGGEIPWYVFELPVIVVGCGQPTMLADIPQARTYINTYDAKDTTFDALVDNLMRGKDAFRGKDPIDSFCGLFDTRL